MKGLILELRGPFAIVLLPGGELRRVLCRRGWQVGMIVDPDAVRSGGFARAGLAISMVLVLMLGLGAYQLFTPRSDVPLTSAPDGSMPPTPVAAVESATTMRDALYATASTMPDPSPTWVIFYSCPVCRENGHELDDHCEYCSAVGHDDDDCPYAPPGWDDDSSNSCPLCKADGHSLDDHCEYCGAVGHDEDDCPYAPPGWDDD